MVIHFGFRVYTANHCKLAAMSPPQTAAAFARITGLETASHIDLRSRSTNRSRSRSANRTSKIWLAQMEVKNVGSASGNCGMAGRGGEPVLKTNRNARGKYNRCSNAEGGIKE